jgi:hypothetical protein
MELVRGWHTNFLFSSDARSIFIFGNETGVTCKRQVGSMTFEEVPRDVLDKIKLKRNVYEEG